MKIKTINKIGLSLNVAGGIISAYSVGENPSGINSIYEGKEIFIAAILHPKLFSAGIWLITIGFILNLFDSCILRIINRFTVNSNIENDKNPNGNKEI